MYIKKTRLAISLSLFLYVRTRATNTTCPTSVNEAEVHIYCKVKGAYTHIYNSVLAKYSAWNRSGEYTVSSSVGGGSGIMECAPSMCVLYT